MRISDLEFRRVLFRSWCLAHPWFPARAPCGRLAGMTGEYRAPQMSCRRGWPDPGCCRYDPGAIAGRKMNGRLADPGADRFGRTEEHTSELQSLMSISYAVF